MLITGKNTYIYHKILKYEREFNNFRKKCIKNRSHHKIIKEIERVRALAALKKERKLYK